MSHALGDRRTPEGNTMSNWINTTVAHLRSRAARGDEGQTAVEYLGIIAVVVAIVLAITGTDIGQTIYDAIVSKIDELTG
jgi:pilus assembly protein Flp/PilA